MQTCDVYVNISPEEKDILFHTCKSVLYHKDQAWQKKGESPVDIGMGSFDGAEKCDLVGLYLLYLLQKLRAKSGLFRDDGLAVCALPARQIEKVKKDICNIFKKEGLDITIDANLKIVDFLDVELNLNTGTHRPFTKPNNIIQYIHLHSNHPPSIKKNIPLAVQKRLSMLSSNEDIFNQAAPLYQNALNKSGYTHNLVYEKQQETFKKRIRRKHITWFHPPFSQNVKSNVGHDFLKILDSSFPPSHILRKSLNRNTVKVSYRTMPNMKSVISKHNSKVLRESRPAKLEDGETGCSCQLVKRTKNIDDCLLEGQCKKSNVIYQAKVTNQTTGNTETYTGLTSTKWKIRYGNHKASFEKRKLEDYTELSKHIWKLKDQSIDHSLSWKILAQGQPYNPIVKKCKLCLLEKYYIMFKPDGASLNSRNEFTSKCRHAAKFLVSNG